MDLSERYSNNNIDAAWKDNISKVNGDASVGQEQVDERPVSTLNNDINIEDAMNVCPIINNYTFYVPFYNLLILYLNNVN